MYEDILLEELNVETAFLPDKVYGVLVFETTYQFEEWQMRIKNKIVQITSVPVMIYSEGVFVKLQFHISVVFERDKEKT